MVTDKVIALWKKNGRWDLLAEAGIVSEETALSKTIGEPAPEPQVNPQSIQGRTTKLYELHLRLSADFEKKLREIALTKYNHYSLSKFVRELLEGVVGEQASIESRPLKPKEHNALSPQTEEIKAEEKTEIKSDIDEVF